VVFIAFVVLMSGIACSVFDRVFARAVYPQGGEQELTAAFLPDRGVFVELGAFHSEQYSQTWYLERKGWTGILVEPVPEHAAEIRARRCACLFEIACGAPEQSGRTTTLHVSGPQTSADPSQQGPVIEVPTRTLEWVLSQAAVTDVDFLSVDVEGAELDVLRGFPFSRVRPRLVLVEDFAEDLAKHRFMCAQRYRRVRRSGNNSWYVPAETPFPVSLFGSWQLFRKYYLSPPVKRAYAFLRGRPYHVR
jgi:FkbM family methyltransferase